MLARIAKALAVTAEGNKPGVGPEKTPRSSGTDPRPDSSVGRMKQAPRPKTARRGHHSRARQRPAASGSVQLLRCAGSPGQASIFKIPMYLGDEQAGWPQGIAPPGLPRIRLVGTLSPGWYVAWEFSIGTA